MILRDLLAHSKANTGSLVFTSAVQALKDVKDDCIQKAIELMKAKPNETI